VEVVRDTHRSWGDWALSRYGLYYATIRGRVRGQEYAIQYRDFASGETSEIYRKDGPFVHQWLAISPGEEWILFVEGPNWDYEVTLVENFR
jgi:hypothetical protein